MGRKCFISFKKEDEYYKKKIQDELNIDMIDISLDKAIDSDDEDYIMQKIRNDYLSNSTVTIHLIGARSSENLGYEEQKFIKRELQASLYDGQENTKNGILGVVLPSMAGEIYGGSYSCSGCGNTISLVRINNNTVVKEFSYNYYIPNGKCHHTEEERYCVLVKWEDFCKNPEENIEAAFEKRFEPIAKKVKVYPD